MVITGNRYAEYYFCRFWLHFFPYFNNIESIALVPVMCTGNCQFILQGLKGCFNTLYSLQDHYRVELLHREIPVVITGNGFAVMYFSKKSLYFHPMVRTLEFLCGPWRTVQGVRCTTLRKIVSCVHLSSPQSRVFFIPGKK